MLGLAADPRTDPPNMWIAKTDTTPFRFPFLPSHPLPAPRYLVLAVSFPASESLSHLPDTSHRFLQHVAHNHRRARGSRPDCQRAARMTTELRSEVLGAQEQDTTDDDDEDEQAPSTRPSTRASSRTGNAPMEPSTDFAQSGKHAGDGSSLGSESESEDEDEE
eukprot:2621614-Rhodomonas_salina.1